MGERWRSTAEKTGQPRLPMRQVYQILEANTKPVEYYKVDSILDMCKYVRLARKYHYTHYRLFFYKDIKPLKLGGSFSTFQHQFFADAGCSVGVFNTINNHIVSIVFRATNAKEFMNYSLIYNLYGLDLIDNNFKYHDWIVLTEGIYDADVLRQIYPNVLATLTSNITVMMADVLTLMTDRVIVAYDADDAGASGFDKVLKRMTRFNPNCIIKKLPVFPGDKDIGVMEEKVDNPVEYSIRHKYYEETLREVMSDESEMILL